MNTENEMNEEVRQLLDSLEEHGKNTRRQKELGELIDQLSEKELNASPSLTNVESGDLRGGTTKQSRLNDKEETTGLLRSARNDAKRRKPYPLWWAIGAAAAALLLLWLLVKPDVKQNPDRNEEILVEETGTVDTVIIEVNEEVHEEPVIEETLLAEETNQPGLLRCARNDVPDDGGLLRCVRNDGNERLHEEIVQEQLIAEAPYTEPSDHHEPTDTANIGSNNIPDANETPSAVQSHKRRVIRSLNLVCYECQKDPEIYPQSTVNYQLSTVNSHLSTTLFGQLQDPNMKDGSLAFDIKLN